MQVSNKTFNLQQNFAPRTPPPEIRPIEPYNRLLEKVLLGNNHKKREVLSNFSFGTQSRDRTGTDLSIGV